jgi:hypothetical protein
MYMAVLKTLDKDGNNPTNMLSIKWSYANKTSDVRMPYGIPIEIAGAANIATDGVLDDWVNFNYDKVLKSFTIEV